MNRHALATLAAAPWVDARPSSPITPAGGQVPDNVHLRRLWDAILKRCRRHEHDLREHTHLVLLSGKALELCSRFMGPPEGFDAIMAWSDDPKRPVSPLDGMQQVLRLPIVMDRRIPGHLIAGWSPLDGCVWRVEFGDSYPFVPDARTLITPDDQETAAAGPADADPEGT